MEGDCERKGLETLKGTKGKGKTEGMHGVETRDDRQNGYNWDNNRSYQPPRPKTNNWSDQGKNSSSKSRKINDDEYWRACNEQRALKNGGYRPANWVMAQISRGSVMCVTKRGIHG